MSGNSYDQLFFFKYDCTNNTYNDCLVGLVVVSATTEQRVLGSIAGSDKVLLGFSPMELQTQNHDSIVVRSRDIWTFESYPTRYIILTNELYWFNGFEGNLFRKGGMVKSFLKVHIRVVVCHKKCFIHGHIDHWRLFFRVVLIFNENIVVQRNLL